MTTPPPTEDETPEEYNARLERLAEQEAAKEERERRQPEQDK